MITEITNLKINPLSKGSDCLAYCTVEIGGALEIDNVKIMDGKKGIYVRWPININLIKNAATDYRKEFSNRILATYVVNHCVDEYDEPKVERIHTRDNDRGGTGHGDVSHSDAGSGL